MWIIFTPLPGDAGESSATAVKVPADELPVFLDDLKTPSLQTALAESIHYFDKIPRSKLLRFADREFPAGKIAETLQCMADLLQNGLSAADFASQVQEQFDVYVAARGDAPPGTVLVTGYYEPLAPGSLVRGAEYPYPLYVVPDDLVVVPAGSVAGSVKKQVGRRAGGKIVSYWTREQIERRDLLSGHELVFLADPVDAFVLHVQGSGWISLKDGTLRSVRYAGDNGRPYRSIGRLLADEGKMRLEEVTLPRIRKYLNDHPSDIERVLRHNERYIFFQWDETREHADEKTGPIGTLGAALTVGRSIALDMESFPGGGLFLLQSRKPLFNNAGEIAGWMPMSRFVLGQDTGAAIKGAGRADLFWGRGRRAEAAAGNMKHPGKLYMLLKK